MESFISFILFIFLILIPAIAIFSFVSKLTTGIYNWADNQPTKVKQKQPVKAKVIKPKPITRKVKTNEKELVTDYLGYPVDLEDSEELKTLLDNKNFDFRNYLKK